MNFFFRKKEVVVPQKLELLSVHIPKSAGTSFRNTLKDVYGEKHVVRTDISMQNGDLMLNEVPVNPPVLPVDVRVCHGHFRLKEFYEMFPEHTQLPVITWLRNPAQRVISNYFFLVQQIEQELIDKDKQQGKWKRMQRTLPEFAADPRNQNRMSFFLEGKNIDDYLFVGITEDYNNDLQRLAKLLNWDNAPSFEHNKTRNKKEVTDSELISQIEKWNQKDMDIYNYILNKKKRL